MSNTAKPKKKGEIHLNLDSAALKSLAAKTGAGLSRYAAILFFVLIAGVYGFVILRINIRTPFNAVHNPRI